MTYWIKRQVFGYSEVYKMRMDVWGIIFMKTGKKRTIMGYQLMDGQRREGKTNRGGGGKDSVFTKEWRSLVCRPLGRGNCDQCWASLVAVAARDFDFYLRPALPILPPQHLSHFVASPPQPQLAQVSLCWSQMSSYLHHVLWYSISSRSSLTCCHCKPPSA